MSKFVISIVYWNNDSNIIRHNNVRFCWNYLQKFTDFAMATGLNIQPYLFDFSVVSSLPESIWVPEFSGKIGYLRSAKINWVIHHLKKENADFFSIVDADVFISENHFPLLIKYLRDLLPDQLYVFKIKNLLNPDLSISFITFDVSYALILESGIKYLFGQPTLGGLFFVSYEKLIELGGFDERFISWGGEDDEMYNRLLSSGVHCITIPITAYHLPHLKDPLDHQQYARQLQIILKNPLPNFDRTRKTAIFIIRPEEKHLVRCFPHMDNLRTKGYNIIVCGTSSLRSFIRLNNFEFYDLKYFSEYLNKSAANLCKILFRTITQPKFVKKRYTTFLKEIDSLFTILNFTEPWIVYLDQELSIYEEFLEDNIQISTINTAIPLSKQVVSDPPNEVELDSCTNNKKYLYRTLRVQSTTVRFFFWFTSAIIRFSPKNEYFRRRGLKRQKKRAY